MSSYEMSSVINKMTFGRSSSAARENVVAKTSAKTARDRKIEVVIIAEVSANDATNVQSARVRG